MPDTWSDLCAIDEVPPASEGGKYLARDGHILAIFRFEDGTVRVMDDRCPHAGASLSAGSFDPELNCIVCPWHHWPFDVDHGRCYDNPAIAVRTYPAEVREGRVWARL